MPLRKKELGSFLLFVEKIPTVVKLEALVALPLRKKTSFFAASLKGRQTKKVFFVVGPLRVKTPEPLSKKKNWTNKIQTNKRRWGIRTLVARPLKNNSFCVSSPMCSH